MLAWRSTMSRCTRRSTSRTSVQVVLGRQPGPREQPVVVGAALAVDEHELDGRAGGELAEQMADQHGLAEPGQPGDHDPGDLGQPDDDRGAVLGPAQPPRRQGLRGHAGQVDPGRQQQRIPVQPAQPDPARSLLLGPDGHTAPGVGQVRRRPAGSRPGQPRPWRPRWRSRPGRQRRTRPSGSGAGGSTGPGSRGRGSGRAAATRPPTAGPAGSAPGRRPAGDGGGPGEPAAGGPSRQPARVAVPPTRASSSESPTRVASISAPLPGSTGVGGGGRSAARHSSARPAPRRRRRPGRASGSGYASRSHTPGSRGCRPTSASHPLRHRSGQDGRVGQVGRLDQGSGQLPQRSRRPLDVGAGIAASVEADRGVQHAVAGVPVVVAVVDGTSRDDDPRLMEGIGSLGTERLSPVRTSLRPASATMSPA